MWLPDEEVPGLAMSRAFRDYCIKDFGLIFVPEVTQTDITSQDQFIVLAIDGVCHVLSGIVKLYMHITLIIEIMLFFF